MVETVVSNLDYGIVSDMRKSGAKKLQEKREKIVTFDNSAEYTWDIAIVKKMSPKQLECFQEILFERAINERSCFEHINITLKDGVKDTYMESRHSNLLDKDHLITTFILQHVGDRVAKELGIIYKNIIGKKQTKIRKAIKIKKTGKIWNPIDIHIFYVSTVFYDAEEKNPVNATLFRVIGTAKNT